MPHSIVLSTHLNLAAAVQLNVAERARLRSEHGADDRVGNLTRVTVFFCSIDNQRIFLEIYSTSYAASPLPRRFSTMTVVAKPPASAPSPGTRAMNDDESDCNDYSITRDRKLFHFPMHFSGEGKTWNSSIRQDEN